MSVAVLALLLAASLVSAALTFRVRAWAQARAMLDLPGARRNHRVPTPRGGGVAIVAVTVGIVLSALLSTSALPPGLLALLFGTVLVAVIGWRDDRGGVAAGVRLCVHTLAAIVFLATLRYASEASHPWWAYVVAVVFVVGLTNVWNFMDGIDGIATSQAILIALAAATLLHSDAARLLALVLAFACIGFLPFNFPHASIFLGDVGSGAIGFMLAGLCVLAFFEGRSAVLWSIVLLLSAFLVDATMTLGMRVVQRRRWWRAHREHTYQWLVRAGYSHARVSCGYALWTLAMLVLVLRAPVSRLPTLAAIVLVFAVLVWLSLRRWVLRLTRERVA